MILSSLCYLEKEGNYLMLHRTKKQKDINKGKWLGVGGKLEKDETPEECIIREVKEETGLQLEEYELRGFVTYVSNQCQTEYMYVFYSNKFSGQLQECNEGELAWIKKEDVLSLPTWEGDHFFIENILNNEPFFSMKFVYEGDKLIDYIIKEYEK